MGNSNKFKVGDEFTLNCGIAVKIIEVIDSNKVVVADTYSNTKEVSPSNLSRGKVRWNIKSRKPVVGERFSTKYYGTFVVLSIDSCDSMTIKFDDTGFIRSGIYPSTLNTGYIRDLSVPKYKPSKVKYPIGSRWKSNKHGWAFVVDVEDNKNITVEFETSNNRVVTTGAKLRSGSFIDKENVSTDSSNKFYVYMAYYKGEVVYVGKGFYNRYLHCNSGTSHCYELNRLHFSGEEVEVFIFRDGLSDDKAIALESELISTMQPKFNLYKK